MAASTLPASTANPMKDFQDALLKSSGAMSAVAARHMRPERMIKVAVGAAMRNPTLLKCDLRTVVRSVIQAAELGLECGSALGEAHLVPFKNNKRGGIYECQMIPGYRGLVTLARRSGEISTVMAEVVYFEDEFTYELGTEPVLKHVPNMDIEMPDRFWPARDQAGEVDPDVDCRWKHVKCVYAVALLKDGGRQIAVMPRNAVERIRQRSMAKDNGPWVTDWEEMGKKTLIKRISKQLPMSVELARAIEVDNATETGDFSGVDFDSPEATEGLEPEKVVPTGASAAGMEGAKASLKEKLANKAAGENAPKAAEDLAAAAKLFDLDKEKIAEITTSLAAINGGPAYDEFLIQAVKDGLQGFSQLLARLNELRQADQGGDGQGKLV